MTFAGVACRYELNGRTDRTKTEMTHASLALSSCIVAYLIAVAELRERASLGSKIQAAKVRIIFVPFPF